MSSDMQEKHEAQTEVQTTIRMTKTLRDEIKQLGKKNGSSFQRYAAGLLRAATEANIKPIF